MNIDEKVLNSDEFLTIVMNGLREYNRNKPPTKVEIKNGKQVPPDQDQQKYHDQQMVKALRQGMQKALYHYFALDGENQ